MQKQTYELKIDSYAFTVKRAYYFKDINSCHVTETMTLHEAAIIKKALEQLGHTVIGRSI